MALDGKKRTTEHNNTLAVKQGNQAVTKSNQIPRGRDQHKNWARPPQGSNRREKGSNNRQGRGADNSQTKDRHKEAQPPTKRSTTTTEGHSQPHRQKHQHNKTTANKGPRMRGSETQDQGQRRQGEHSPNQDRTKPTHQTNQKGGPRGDKTLRRHAKGPPPHRSKWEQVAMWCPGKKGTGNKLANVTTKPREEEKEGEGRYVKLRVVYSR